MTQFNGVKTLSEIKEGISKYFSLDEHLEELLTDPSDIVDGYPTLFGLRKLAKAMGYDVVGIHTKVHTYSPESACVTVTVSLLIDGMTYDFCGTGDCSAINTEEPFLKFPSAMAETRGFARALRNALNIKKCSFDEKEEQNEEDIVKSTSDNPADNTSYIKTVILTIAKRDNVDIDAILKDKFEGQTLDDLTPQDRQALYNMVKGDTNGLS